MPPETQSDGIADISNQRTITNDQCCGQFVSGWQCEGLLITVNQAKKDNDSWKQGEGENFKFPRFVCERKCLTRNFAELKNFLCLDIPI